MQTSRNITYSVDCK